MGYYNGNLSNDTAVLGGTFGGDPYLSDSPSNLFSWGGQDRTYNDPGNMNSGVKRQSGADLAGARYRGLADYYRNMAAPTTDYGQANGYLGMGGQARGMDLQSRGEQQNALAMMRARASGQVPSIAAMQANNALSRGLNDQMSQVASARGGVGNQALAARAGMMSGAQMRGDVAGQSAVAAANERMDAERAYFGGASGMRQGDQGTRGLDYGAAGMTAGWAQNQSALEMQQRQLGLQGGMGYEGMDWNTMDEQMKAQMAMQALAQGKWQAQMGVNEQYNDRVARGLAGAVSGAATAGVKM